MGIYDSLNEMQRQAVLHDKGPLLILAGAGSGKTRVITHRIAYLIEECGVNPFHILAITFTNKAAREMRERVDSLVGYGAENVWVSTFHSTCVRILRRFADAVGYDTNFSIYDTDDQKRLMRELLREHNVDPKKFPAKHFLSEISNAKNKLITPEEVLAQGNDRNTKQLGTIYMAYQRALRNNNAFDFDDLLMKTVELFHTSEEALTYYRNRFHYILVDEYQDTNVAQFEFIRLLANHRNEYGEIEQNLCVVGDDDQSIYRFRGANIRNILDFEKTYPDAVVIKLEQNYRSTGNILAAANAVIAHNYGRKDKALWTAETDGSPIRYTSYDSDRDEAREIVSEIASLVEKGEASYRDFAILYRTNAQSRSFEEQMIYRGVPHKLVGGVGFYDRKEIKDLLSYLKTIDNGMDGLAVRRILNVPRRGIGETTIARVNDYAIHRGLTFYDALVASDYIPDLNRAAAKIQRFVATIDTLRSNLQRPGYDLKQIVPDILEATGYAEMLKEEDPESYDDRMANINELINKLAFYEENAPTEPTLSDFLSEVALVSDVDEVEDVEDYVVLMTLHSAKGLEFERVYLCGMEEGLFPSGMCLESENADEEIEEERRLCYVGITRAKQHLYLSSAKQRMTRGEIQYNAPSRFVNELPRHLVTWKRGDIGGGSGYSGGGYGNSGRGSSVYGSSGRGDSNYGSSYGSSRRSYEEDDYFDGSSISRSINSRGDSTRGGKAPSGGSDIFSALFASGSGRSPGSRTSTGAGARSSSTGSGGAYRNPYASNPYTSNPYTSNSSTGNRSSGITLGKDMGIRDASELSYQVGDRVSHSKFGIGTVLDLTKGTKDFEVTVQFGDTPKRMLASFAKLVKVD